MTGAIIVTTVTFYIFSWAVTWSLTQLGIFALWAEMIIPPIIAGLFGGLQYARTERHGMRIGTRLLCAFQGCFAIIFAPILISFIISVIFMITGGLSTLTALPEVAGFFTAAGLISLLLFVIYGLPAIFIGLTTGQYLQYRRMFR